jgi:hypothetical protein
VRVAAGVPERALSAAAHAITYVDLQFDDPHVERWLGAGWLRDPEQPDELYASSLVEWARAAFDDQETTLLGELGREFTGDPHDQMASAPIEIVIEGNARMPTLE